jgi:transposase InsO family protein
MRRALKPTHEYQSDHRLACNLDHRLTVSQFFSNEGHNAGQSILKGCSISEECLWGYRFTTRDETFVVIAAWLEKYNTERPQSAVGYLTPKEFAGTLAAWPVRKRGNPTMGTTAQGSETTHLAR